MPDYLVLAYKSFRRILEATKAILSLVLLALSVLKKLLDLFLIS